MPRKTTGTATHEPALSATELETRAERGHASTRERLAAIGTRLSEISAALADVDAKDREAEERATSAAHLAAAQPELVAGAKARLLVMAASVAEGGARSAVAHAEAALQVAQKSAQAAATEAASAHAAAVATRERLDTERVEIEGEQLALQDMLAHLAHVVAESREQRGREILDVATKHAVVLAQVVAGHERELVAARAQLAEHQQQTARDLQAYPVVAERMRGTIVEVPRQPAELETLLGTYLSFLDAVEHAQGHLDGLEVGGLWQVLSAPDPHVIIGALQGYNTWVQGKRHQARTFLESYRERLQLTQQQ